MKKFQCFATVYKYISILLFSIVSIQAAPKVFNSLGNDLELFQHKDCKTYQEISSLPSEIKKECNMFDSKVNNAFKAGYKLDPYFDSEIDEKKLNHYLSLLRDLEKGKEKILTLVYSEMKKARIKNDTDYYVELIDNDTPRLYSSDYEFMAENKDVFLKNKRYLSHIQNMKDLEKRRKSLKKHEEKKQSQPKT